MIARKLEQAEKMYSIQERKNKYHYFGHIDKVQQKCWFEYIIETVFVSNIGSSEISH